MIKNKKSTKALVVSIPSANTLKVNVELIKSHPIYKKLYKVTKSYLVHVQNVSDYQIGETVFIYPIKPLSKRKVWTTFKK